MPIPLSARLAMWATAAQRGVVGFDDALDAITVGEPHLVMVDRSTAPAVDFSAMAGRATTTTTARLVEVLIEWRRRDAGIRLVLPVPGDVRGAPSEPSFLAAAIAAGQAVHGGGVALVPTLAPRGPSSAPPSVTWQAFGVGEPAPDPLQLNEAEHDLARAMRETATLLRGAQLGGVRGVAPAELESIRRIGSDFDFAPGFAPRSAALVAQAERLAAMLELAERDSVGGAIDGSGIAMRAQALRELRTTVRRARLAGYNSGYPVGVTDHDIAGG